MRIRCPHCLTTVDLGDHAGSAGPIGPEELTGFDQACASCGDRFSVYLY